MPEKLNLSQELLEAQQARYQELIEKARYLDKNKVNAKYRHETDMCQHDCPICGGTGWLRVDCVSYLDEQFGKLIPCPKLNMVKPSESGEKPLQWDSLDLKTPSVGEAKFAVQKAIERGSGWVYLHGSFGLAKSMILKIATNDALANHVEAAYVRMADFVHNLRLAFDDANPNHTLQDKLDYWTDLPFLAIDEVEKVSLTDFAREKMFLMLDKRYEAAKAGKSITLMASNVPPIALDAYLADRIQDKLFSVVELKGKSERRSWFDGSDTIMIGDDDDIP